MNEIINIKDLFKKSALKLDSFVNISYVDVAFGLGLSVLIGLFIFYIYKRTFRGVVYSYNYNITFVLMTMITSLVIMTISTNIVLSLGMVGALSIVRFRTAIKDPLDVAFMFWAIAAGIATGAGVYPVSVVGSLLIGLVILVMSRHKMKDSAYLLVIHFNETANDQVKLQLKKLKHVLKSKTVRKDQIEMTVEVRLKDDNTGFVHAISEIEGVRDAVLVSYNGDYAP